MLPQFFINMNEYELLHCVHKTLMHLIQKFNEKELNVSDMNESLSNTMKIL